MLFGEGILIDSLFYLHKTLTKSEKSDKMYEVKLYAFFVIAKFLTKNFDKMVVEILSHTVNLKQNLLMGGKISMKKKLMSVLLAAAMVASMAVGCGSDKKASSDSGDTKKTESTETKTESNQILFNGSSTLAPVITSIATDFFDTYGTWDAYNSSLPKEDIAIYVSAGGSGQGTKAVIDGTSTFGMVARSVKDEEKEAIKDEKEYQVGIDALTIAVNPENPVTGVLDDLSTEQIVSLFSGKYATWKDLDPSLPDEEVVVITRDINGGAHEVFQKNIMGDTEVSSEAIQASSMGELVQDIIDNKYAIGYASFGVANQNAGKVVTLKVNGVEPTKENIIDGSYIIQRPLLIVGSGNPTDVQQAFLDVILGETGQKTVEDMGFIPMK
mgnify:CR=1 FL=1